LIGTPVILNDDTTIKHQRRSGNSPPAQNPLGKLITRSGSGALTIAGPQVHGPNSSLAIVSVER